jgi:hypothetical protein
MSLCGEKMGDGICIQSETKSLKSVTMTLTPLRRLYRFGL